jgi:hypothetical protein
MARCLALAMSHAPGLSGTPDCGHCSSAATRASCARSSATPTSRTIRARLAISFGDSIRQTASMARCISVAATATNHIIFNPTAQGPHNEPQYAASPAATRRSAPVYSGPPRIVGVARTLLRRRPEGIAWRARWPPPWNSPEIAQTPDHFLSFRERPIGDLHRAVRETNARTHSARQAALHSEQLAGLHPLLDQLAHPRDFFFRGRYICFDRLVYAQKFHEVSPREFGFAVEMAGPPQSAFR